ncbi:uncharacterized protein LOC128392546 [Panonychus citri]|uniref:uncharacterized protein LOC128392546 n=1 Tax=Panonychus citri TaxID=50023 RepID=UPI0023073A22|nr:uncharacterized protein LOC128392546 [Panonychus citri]
MTEPKFSMVHQADLYEETIVDGFAIYAFLSYSDCEESARQQDCLDDTEEEESVNGDKKTQPTVGRSPSSVGYNNGQRSRSDSRSSIGDTPNGSIYLENGKNMLFHRSVTRRKAGRPKGGHRRSKVQIKHEIFNNLCDPSIDAQQFSCLYNDYLQARFKEEEKNKYKFTLPKSMDENFINLSLNALDSSLVKEKPSFKVEKIKKELKNGTEDEDISDDYHSKKGSFDKIPETGENVTDLTEMISRHSKREIRLPARYHQSGILMGSQWIIPDYGQDERTPKKRIKIEEVDESKPQIETQMRTQTSVIHHKSEQLQRQPLSQPQIQPQHNLQASVNPQSSPSPQPQLQQKSQPQQNPPPLLHKHSHFKPLYSCENQRIIFPTSNSSNLDRTSEDDKSLSSDLFNEPRESVTNVDDLPNLNSPTKTCPSHVSQLKLHQEKLERLQLLRKQQEICGKFRDNNSTVINNSSKDYPYQESTVDMIMSIVSPADRSELNNIDAPPSPPFCASPELSLQNSQSSSMVPILNPNSSRSSSDSPTPMDNSDVQDQKSPRQQQLRQLYRDLYFENRPERKLIHAKSRIKPRVNKKSEVEEAIKVIEKLNKRNKQLDYIKSLLIMWNKKLVLAAKVINDKDVIPKGVDIVRDVLKTYQASKSYKLTQAWDSLNKPKTPASSIAISSFVSEPPQLLQPCQPPSSPQPPQASQTPQLSRQLVRPGSSVIKTTGSLSRIVMNPQAKANSTPESRVFGTLTLPVATTTITTITSSAKTVDDSLSMDKTPGVISRNTYPPPRIKTMVPLNQSQSSNQPSHLHIHPSLPPPPPPSLQTSFSITSLTRPPTQALPTLSTPLPNHAHLTSSMLPNIQHHSQANMKPIPLILSPGTLNNNLFSSTRGYGSRHKSSGDVHLCTMPRLPLPNNMTVSPVVNNSGGTSKPTIIKPTTFFLTPNANASNSPLYRFLKVKGDINRVLLTPQITPHIYKKPLLIEPFLGPVMDPPVEVSVQSDNQDLN